MPGGGIALETIKSAIRALVPLLVASVAVLVVAAGTLGARSVDFVVLVGAVGYAIRCAIASAAVRSAFDADSRAVEPGERTEVKSVSTPVHHDEDRVEVLTYTAVTTAKVASVEICILAVRWRNKGREFWSKIGQMSQVEWMIWTRRFDEWFELS